MGVALDFYILNILEVGKSNESHAKIMWLYGFDIALSRARLYTSSVRSYISMREEMFPSFEYIVPYDLASSLAPGLEDRTIMPVFLPIDEKIHLLFWLAKDNTEENVSNFLYGAYTIDNESYSRFPIIDLKLSFQFDNKYLAEQARSGILHYDNALSIGKQSMDLVRKTYNELYSFMSFSCSRIGEA